ncbi:hypothetical protein PsorP6_017760 [Peronosclerospora sorghi]|uniref:Uncharacterized protein n=1 Tax=Peronosclerospora sorghi TaxID=230839 RepID=A0ACC0WMX1_9STRA|nr:hypothetical protein PsorP6_017760 [Peronosclerospora sorghi]
MGKKRLIKSMVKTRYELIIIEQIVSAQICLYIIVQPLEDLLRVKKARIQFTIEKPDPDAEEEDDESKLQDQLHKKIKPSMILCDLKSLVFHHFEEREFSPLMELNYNCRLPEMRTIWRKR